MIKESSISWLACDILNLLLSMLFIAVLVAVYVTSALIEIYGS